jgi:serine/threonine protein kinase
MPSSTEQTASSRTRDLLTRILLVDDSTAARDRRSDLYSLGVALYELCTGQLPFQAEDVLEVVHAHIARKPAPPRAHRPDLPEVLENIILRLLAKMPDQRYQTAAGVAADLERVHEARATVTVSYASRGSSTDGRRRARPCWKRCSARARAPGSSR